MYQGKLWCKLVYLKIKCGVSYSNIGQTELVYKKTECCGVSLCTRNPGMLWCVKLVYQRTENVEV